MNRPMSEARWDRQPPGDSGWRQALNETWELRNSYAPVYRISTPGNVLYRYSTGIKISMTHEGATKYFIVMGCEYASGYNLTSLYIYGGTDYTLGTGEITDFCFAAAHAPIGFPLDPRKWSVTVTDTSNRSQATPTLNVWYNLGGVSISIPFGLWRVRYEASARSVAGTNATSMHVATCLSATTGGTAAAPIPRLSDATLLAGAAHTGLYAQVTHIGQGVVAQATESPVTYYLNIRTATADAQYVQIRGNVRPTVIEAECAYL